jgi:hypothetical protein
MNEVLDSLEIRKDANETIVEIHETIAFQI